MVLQLSRSLRLVFRKRVALVHFWQPLRTGGAVPRQGLILQVPSTPYFRASAQPVVAVALGSFQHARRPPDEQEFGI